MRSDEVQSLLLKSLSNSGVDRRLGQGRHYLAEEVHARAPATDKPSQQQILAAYWSLIGQGLAYIDMGQSAPENWQLVLTPAGAAAVQDQQASPDDPAGYLRTLYTNVPQMKETVRLYIDEAVKTYNSQAYLACTVMLGVAAEAAFIEVAGAF